jgi:hypothetical protein
MRGHKQRMWITALGVAFTLGLLGALGCVGCGEDQVLATTTSTSSPADAPTEVGAIFTELAQTLAPMPVYGLRDLPSGLTIASEWWPVVALDTPSDYDGPVETNPRVSGEGEIDPEVQFVFRDGEGWIVVVENFRGDLGDVAGEQVGSVSGRTATLYEVNGGTLVQWSDGGRWYGVFGRGVSKEDVVDLALAMRAVDTKNVE